MDSFFREENSLQFLPLRRSNKDRRERTQLEAPKLCCLHPRDEAGERHTTAGDCSPASPPPRRTTRHNVSKLAREATMRGQGPSKGEDGVEPPIPSCRARGSGEGSRDGWRESVSGTSAAVLQGLPPPPRRSAGRRLQLTLVPPAASPRGPGPDRTAPAARTERPHPRRAGTGGGGRLEENAALASTTEEMPLAGTEGRTKEEGGKRNAGCWGLWVSAQAERPGDPPCSVPEPGDQVYSQRPLPNAGTAGPGQASWEVP